MSDLPALEKYDFTRPTGLANDLADRWTSWMDSLRNLFKERWSSVANQEIHLHAANNIVLSFGTARSRLPTASAAYYLSVGKPPLETLMVLERPTALGLVLLSLGEALAERPADRELSMLEMSVLELILSHIARGLGDAWPGKDPLPGALGAAEPQAHRCRMLAPNKVVLLVKLNVTIAENTDAISWIIPHTELETLLSQGESTVTSPADQRKIERRARDIPVAVSVNLGDINLAMSDLAALDVGDLILLRQKITEPLPVLVAGHLKFQAWPGRRGNRSAVKICQIV